MKGVAVKNIAKHDVSAASGHPTWSVAYAEDVPALLAEIERLNEDARLHAIRAVDRYHKLGADRDRWRTIADDMAQVLRDLAKTTQGRGPARVRHICQGALIDYEAAKAGEAE